LNFPSLLSDLGEFDIRYLTIILHNTFEFCENWQGKWRAFPLGVKSVTFLPVQWHCVTLWMHRTSQNVCLLRDGVRHLQYCTGETVCVQCAVRTEYLRVTQLHLTLFFKGMLPVSRTSCNVTQIELPSSVKLYDLIWKLHWSKCSQDTVCITESFQHFCSGPPNKYRESASEQRTASFHVTFDITLHHSIFQIYVFSLTDNYGNSKILINLCQQTDLVVARLEVLGAKQLKLPARSGQTVHRILFFISIKIYLPRQYDRYLFVCQHFWDQSFSAKKLSV